MDEILKKGKKLLKKASETAEDIVETAKSEYEGSSIQEKVNTQTEKASEFIKESGLADAYDKTTEKAGEQFDVVSGAKMFQLVKERLDIQEKYNDILASKLEEALTRIESLESKFDTRDS